MKYLHKLFLVAIILLVAAYFPGFAQGGHHGGGHHGGQGGPGYCDPDSLTLVTVSGVAIVDTSMMHAMYYLDEDGDQQADYHLNFGPYWYEPDSGNATRPLDGDSITIYGGLYDSTMGALPVIIVYEINGEFWRDPYDPFWNNMGGHHGGHHNHTWGWMHDSLQVVTVSGTALVDTTFIFNSYFLDETGDTLPDYFLNFGPPWYEPPSGATRPNNGDAITIVGALLDRPALPMIIVFEINGQVWRDSTGFGHFMGGGWIHRFMNQAQHAYSPFDHNDWMNINPGWHGGMMMPDSLFCQMIEIFPQNTPNLQNQNAFAGYELGLFNTNGGNMLQMGGMMGGHMNFANSVQFKLHYNDIQLQGFNIDESSVTVKYWDEQSSTWVEPSNTVLDQANNTITFSDSRVSSYLILTGTENPLSVIDNGSALPGQFTLGQNYPNPFNPSTTIRYELSQNAHVVLSIYNVLGQKLLELVNGQITAGEYEVNFDASSLSSGIYFYELKVGDQSRVMKMNLMK